RFPARDGSGFRNPAPVRWSTSGRGRAGARECRIAGTSGRLQDGFDGGDIATPAGGLRTKGSPARGGEAVVLGLAVVLGGAPLTVDPALDFEALQGGVERALVHVQDAGRKLLDPLADAPAMHGLEREGLEDQKLEGAAEDVVLLNCHEPTLVGIQQKMPMLLSEVNRSGRWPVVSFRQPAPD